MASNSPSASASEGEIVETEFDNDIKASTAQSEMRDMRVDRQSRTSRPGSASTSTSTEDSVDHGITKRHRLGARSRSRSPYRHKSPPPRGEKRRREHESASDYRDRHDKRRFKVHYEGAAGRRFDDDRSRNRISYADLDRNDNSSQSRRDDTASRQRDRRHRTRSRSPYSSRQDSQRKRESRPSESNSRRNSPGRGQQKGGLRGFEPSRDRSDWGQDVSQDGSGPKAVRFDPAIPNGKGAEESSTNKSNEGVVELEPAELDEAAQIEARRKRREELKAKLKSQPTPLLVQALHIGDSGPATPKTNTPRDSRSASPAVDSPRSQNVADSPSAFLFDDDQELANHTKSSGPSDDADGPSAADYDPTVDMEEDRTREDQRTHIDIPSSGYNENKNDEHDILMTHSITQKPEESSQPKKNDFDMFADDDDDDMFASDPVTKPTANAVSKPKTLDANLLDNWDDSDGYYRVILGELLDGRYHVQAHLGKGMFAAVVRAEDSKTGSPVAIKIVRSNETMKKAGLKEIDILQRLSAADPEGKKHVIRLERHFEHKGHLCMVFENMSINLREVLKKFGRDVGINLKAVRSYAQQMFLALSLMKKCNILHADIKPDNMLVNDTRNILKICDLGSAGDADENEITPYLVSRFYRAPEIILGMNYDFGIDTWSIGCTLFEMYTGKILFTGRNNNQMLRSIMECRGKFSLKMLKKAEYAGLHFDDNLMFRSVEKDKITGKDVIRMLNFLKPTRDLKTRLLGTTKGLGDADLKELNLFVDLLDRCLSLNPEKRLTPVEALKHPFINRMKT